MPNWAYNSLIVTGSVDAMDKWRIALANEKDTQPRLLLNTLFPMPKEFEEGDKWYHWRVEHWGTKWDIGEGEFGILPEDSSPTDYMYSFDTAWSPPLQWLEHVGSNFPDLRFELGWWEEQMYFGGVMVIENGQIVQNDYHEGADFYDWADDYLGMDFRPDDDWEVED